jgi:hypothetical protein
MTALGLHDQGGVVRVSLAALATPPPRSNDCWSRSTRSCDAPRRRRRRPVRRRGPRVRRERPPAAWSRPPARHRSIRSVVRAM